MKITIGDYNILEVLRETDIAYLLTNGEDEVFLHKKQATRKLQDGEKIEVFLYYDNQKRATATMKKPSVDLHTAAFVEVVDVNFHLGVFLNVGLIKDLLLSRDDLPFVKKEWPKKGDLLFVKMKASKNQLTAKIIPRYEVVNMLKPQTELELDETYDAYCIYKTEEGVVFITKEGHYIYVYFKHMRKIYRLGEKAQVKITINKGDYRYNGTLIEQKELMMSKDAEYIMKYLNSVGGEMPFTDKTDSEKIQEVFRMSKNAFKRALGTLYKEKAIELHPDKTSLVQPLEK